MMHSHHMIYPGSVWIVNKSQNSSIRPAPYILHYVYIRIHAGSYSASTLHLYKDGVGSP